MSRIEEWLDGRTGEAVTLRDGQAGIIVLNRPAQLNAVTAGMVETIRDALASWADDPAVTRVVICGAGGKAFSAGGDIRRIYDAGKAGTHAESLDFWRDEYLLNIAIKRYPKPFVALIDGIVMGGGVGLSLHGSHRVAGGRTLFAMPEVGIGFFPDVGATYALPRLPGRTGTWLALTGARIKAGDALALGIATHAAPSEAFDAIARDLAAGRPIDETLAAVSSVPEPALGPGDRSVVDRCFAGGSVAEILAALDDAANTTPFAQEAARTLRSRSPLSMAIALRQMRLGATLSFEEAMALEFRIVSRMVDNPDFYEGVRAVVVDKDQSPRWQPSSLDGVTGALVDRFFAGLGPDELPIGQPGRA
jgi:enoyl-CoA hydratase